MTYMHFAPNGWHNRRTAEDKMNDAMDAMRKERNGPDWYRLDLWGRPVLKEENTMPSNYLGKPFVEGMARKISKGISL